MCYHKMIQILKILLIIQGFTNIHLSSALIINTTCLTLPQNHCFQTAFRTLQSSCDGWICWESQLTLSNKRFIVTTFNQYRNSEAQNVTNMNKLIWHWALEQEAIRASSTCQRKYVERYEERRNIPGLGFSLLCENGCIYREGMVLPSQTLFKQLLYSFLRENGTYSHEEYSSEESFLKGNTLFVGCALVVIRAIIHNSYQNIFALVCVFCTRDAEFETIYSNSAEKICPPPGIRGGDKRYSNLCSQSLRNIFLCEPENPCPDDNRTEIWQVEFEGLVSRLTFLQTNIGPLLLVNESITNVQRLHDGSSTSVTTTRYYVDKEGLFGEQFQNYPSIPESIYFHPKPRVDLFNDILHSVAGPNVTYVYVEDAGVCQVIIPSAATEGSADAFCCLFLMLVTILTTIILCGLCVYTIKDYRKKIQ